MDTRERMNLDRYITRSDESTLESDGEKLLSDDCEAHLAAREWYSRPSPFGAALVYICDEDGTRLFEVTRGIDAFDLSQLLRYADMRYRYGEQYGKSALQHAMRSLLNVAPLEPAE